jgi:hypothetical protein
VFNHPTGAVTMTRGLAKALFGIDWRALVSPAVVKTVDVAAHQRTRVIGQPSIAVKAHQYQYKAFPSMDSTSALGGQPVTVVLANGDKWTLRVSGAMDEFLSWIGPKLVTTNTQFVSQRGTIYGPFGVSSN